jgi:bacterioferritin
MRGDPQVLEALNAVLTAELTAINQYFIHHRMCENWGYLRLSKKKREESIDEMKDADRVIARILYLDGVPNMQRMNPVRVGEDAVEQHRLDLALETEAIGRLNDAIELARSKGDNGTREMLETILAGEEHSADWLEGQLHIVEEIGKERYLAEQIHE